MRVPASRAFLPVLGLVAIFATAGCGGVVDPSKNTTDTFTGTIQPGNGNFGEIHTFNTSKSGEVTVKVTRFDPPINVYFSIGYYQNLSTGCAPIQIANFAVVGTSAINGVINPGSYCVVVFDQGGFTVPETYTLTVSHP
jgi:hypothetical protein